MWFWVYSFLFIPFIHCMKNPRVVINSGELEGSVLHTFNHRKVFGFRGIPYAKPPVGSLRFKLPQPVHPWDGIKDATQDGPICPQITFGSGQPAGQEDCLVLNVYSPQLPTERENTSFAVMVYIHGGGFMAGDSTSRSIGPRKLLDQDIVLVTMNYRLNVLGFLSTEDDSCPGNFGLWDQRLALQWVQDNIHSFGGDKNRVTIFGGSAGAASVILHVLSEASSGLFHRAIAQSGSALCHWAVQERPLQGAQDLARDVGCPTSPTHDLVHCLRKKDPIEMAKTARTYLSADGMLPLTFAPVVEKTNGSKFLADYPDNLVKAGEFTRVPVILGVTEDEGIIALINIERHYKSLDAAFLKEHLDQVLTVIGGIDSDDVADIKQRYLQNIDFENPDKEQLKRTLLKVISDGFFKACNQLTVQHFVKKEVPTFMYILAHAHSNSFCRAVGYKQDLGVSHGDDEEFFFDRENVQDFKGKDKQLSQQLIEMWTNFAKYGFPTPEGVNNSVGVSWEQVKEGEMNYLSVDLPMKTKFSSDNYQFWNEKSLKSEKRRRRTIHDEL